MTPLALASGGWFILPALALGFLVGYWVGRRTRRMWP